MRGNESMNGGKPIRLNRRSFLGGWTADQLLTFHLLQQQHPIDLRERSRLQSIKINTGCQICCIEFY